MPETLADLIAQYKGVRSFMDLARESGGEISHGSWQRYGDAGRTYGGRTPDTESLKVVARVLGISERRLWLAVGASVGMDVNAPSESRLHLALSGLPLDDLTQRQVDLIQGTAGEFLTAQEAADVTPIRQHRRRTGNEGRGANRQSGKTGQPK